MRQTIHILRKDVRRLWAPLLIALAVQSLFVFFEMGPQHGPVGFAAGTLSAEALVDLLLPVAWWYLVVRLVHGEALPGDRQFWVTRPYRWNNLLAAKAAFILLFINLPVLIADCLILTAQGFSVGAHWHGILWKQIPFTVVALLPALGLASLTRNLGQVVVAVLLIVLRIVMNSFPLQRGISPGYTAVGWIEDAVSILVLLSVLAAVILIQYRARRTWLARGLFAAFVIVPGFSVPLGWQLEWQARVKPSAVDTAAIRLTFDRLRGPRSPFVTAPITYAAAAFPVNRHSGLSKVRGSSPWTCRPRSARGSWRGEPGVDSRDHADSGTPLLNCRRRCMLWLRWAMARRRAIMIDSTLTPGFFRRLHESEDDGGPAAYSDGFGCGSDAAAREGQWRLSVSC